MKDKWFVGEVKRLEKVVRERTAKRMKNQTGDNDISRVETFLEGSERNKVLAMRLGEKYDGVEGEIVMEDQSNSSQGERRIEFTTFGVSDLLKENVTMEETYDPDVPTSSCNSSSVKTFKKEKVTLGEAYDPEVPTNSCDSSPELEVSLINSIFVTHSTQVEKRERDVEIKTIHNVLAKLWVQKAFGKAQQDNVKLKLDFLKVSKIF